MNRVINVVKDKHVTLLILSESIFENNPNVKFVEIDGKEYPYQVGKSSPEDLGKVLYLPKDTDVKEGQVISTK